MEVSVLTAMTNRRRMMTRIVPEENEHGRAEGTPSSEDAQGEGSTSAESASTGKVAEASTFRICSGQTHMYHTGSRAKLPRSKKYIADVGLWPGGGAP